MNLASPWPQPGSRPRLVLDAAGPRAAQPSPTALAGWERAWKHLHRAARPLNPFLSWEWMSSWAASGRCEALVVGEAFPDGSLAGLLPLERARRRGLAQLQFLAQAAGGDDLDCLLHPAAPPDTAERLLLAALARARWDLIRLEGLRPDAHLRLALQAVANTGVLRRLQLEAGEWLPSLELPLSFEALLASHSPNFRAEVRRRRRALLRRLPQATVECAQSPAAMAAALEHLFRLHNQRRGQKLDRGIFESARLRAFHAAAATKLAAVGQARIYLLRTPAAVLAALYGFQAEHRFLYFQSGFDPALAELSPGTVLLSAVIEDCIRRGTRRFEFLRGDERYKSRWTSERRLNFNALAARSWSGAAFLALRARVRARHAREE